jgi:translation initiation factor 1A
MLGNGRLEVQCFDGVKRLGHIRGKLRKKVWISTGDILLIGLREFQSAKCDVLMRYSPEEARSLKAYGEVPDGTRINEAQVDQAGGDEGIPSDDEGGFTFDDI